MRKRIVAGNWKMNNNLDETKALIKDLKQVVKFGKKENKRVIITPSFISLSSAVKKTKKTKIEVAAQNMHEAKSGAFTGEVSATMLKNIGVNIVILGHSERRTYFNETDESLAKKIDTALGNEMEAIFCFGEEIDDRKSNNHFKVIENQLKNSLFHLQAKAFKNIILAYEPVWAIGTGETASPEQVQEVHAFVRKLIADEFGAEVAENTSILYGGSVKPANAKEIFSNPDVDGGLIGGASLKATDFNAIIEAL